MFVDVLRLTDFPSVIKPDAVAVVYIRGPALITHHLAPVAIESASPQQSIPLPSSSLDPAITFPAINPHPSNGIFRTLEHLFITMSDPYNQYGQQYNQYPPNQYGSPAPGQGYAAPQENYQQGGYQQPGYPQYPPQHQQQGYGDQSQYGQQPYGPPSQGGFQHGQSQAPVPYNDPYQQQQG
jgi:hypothetical protein